MEYNRRVIKITVKIKETGGDCVEKKNGVLENCIRISRSTKIQHTTNVAINSLPWKEWSR